MNTRTTTGQRCKIEFSLTRNILILFQVLWLYLHLTKSKLARCCDLCLIVNVFVVIQNCSMLSDKYMSDFHKNFYEKVHLE